MIVNSVSNQNFGRCSVTKSSKDIIQWIKHISPDKHAKIFETELDKLSDYINLRTPWYKKYTLDLSLENSVQRDLIGRQHLSQLIKVNILNNKKSVSSASIPYTIHTARYFEYLGDSFNYKKAQKTFVKEMENLKRKFTETFLM